MANLGRVLQVVEVLPVTTSESTLAKEPEVTSAPQEVAESVEVSESLQPAVSAGVR